MARADAKLQLPVEPCSLAILCGRALFNGVSELEVNGQYLFVADQNNHRIRRVDLQTTAVDTVLGGAQGGLGWNYMSSDPTTTGVGLLMGMGLSTDGNHLYVAITTRNMVFVLHNVNRPELASFDYVCGQVSAAYLRLRAIFDRADAPLWIGFGRVLADPPGRGGLLVRRVGGGQCGLRCQ